MRRCLAVVLVAACALCDESHLRQYVEATMREDHSTWYDASTESFPSRAAVGARLRAAVARRRLVYGVIGYSITVGRGNYFNQSWPAALERRLARALPGVAVEVRNMAVGASPPYPTCACLAETVGSDVDVVAWEFGMTGGNDGEENLFRSCLRKALELPSRPAFVLIDSQTRRTDVLRRLGALSTVVNLRRAFLASKEDGDGDRWAKQGMPEGCKAAKWHPGVGWHDLTAAALAWHHATAALAADDGAAARPREIRKAGMGNVLHDAWTCRTSMLPRHDAGADLGSIVASRLNAASLDGGWAVAMAPSDLLAAHHMNEVCGAGYPDRKLVLLGAAASGPLALALPAAATRALFCSPPSSAEYKRLARVEQRDKRFAAHAENPGELKRYGWQEDLPLKYASLPSLAFEGDLAVAADGAPLAPAVSCASAYLSDALCVGVELPASAGPRNVTPAVAGGFTEISHVMWSADRDALPQDALCKAANRYATGEQLPRKKKPKKSGKG